ncbi:ATP-binding protein [Bradyrhizobium lablabi]|jgi:predicted ATPase/DNA-binding winged helix-turn-helix (wHTH) protein|uniref:ATP-binding protein n=1 Tax=Bradyrhizobium lablabi TaxID=722472 RepID=UPI0009094573|nr:winged helix-turn-helix domain-containing protein [Bradyrhizobium lablabi]SHL83355.1 transcriptional regulator [Bradyrhizobium lablabi]
MPARARAPVYKSGEWEIDLARRELRSRGTVAPLGARAFEIVEILVQSAGELVNKYDLMDRVWPGAVVEENTLQAHISAVRKVLGSDREMLKTVAGRGYRLLGTWAIQQDDSQPDPAYPNPVISLKHHYRTNFPAATETLIGREGIAQHLRDFLSAYRMVTLTGPGGIGKTVLAVDVARTLFPYLHGDGFLVELASLSHSNLVPSAVANCLGLKIGGESISSELIARAIGSNRMLLVLDNCEHVIDAVAEISQTLVGGCPFLTILATSREVLRIDGEYVYRVPPLDVPPECPSALGDVLAHSAAKLFLTRVQALASDFTPRDEHLRAMAAICRRLDGIPLAIEFAAARAATLGLQEVAERLDDRFAVLTGGRRTALPRHQTLRATLDWSYDLLPENERRLLRRLSVFTGGFTLDAATVVANDDTQSATLIMDGIANLVTKSLLSHDGSASTARWRLLETIRAYALEKLGESGEVEDTSRRHAEYFRDVLAPSALSQRSRLSDEDFARYVREIDNVRAALDWTFSEAGDPSIGVVLTAAYAPVLIRLSLTVECRRHAELALRCLEPQSEMGSRLKMLLTVALGAALYHSTGPAESTGIVLAQGLALADSLDDRAARLRALWAMWSYHYNKGEYRTAQSLADRYAATAREIGDVADELVGDRLQGTTLYHLGEQATARIHLERVRDRYAAPEDQRHIIWLHYDQSVLARSILSKALWLQGLVDQARDTARRCVEDAHSADHKLSLCYALCFASGPVAVMSGELDAAEHAIDMLNDIVATYGVVFWKSLANGIKGQLQVRRGDFAAGHRTLRGALAECDEFGGMTCYTEFLGTLAEASAGLGQTSEARDTIEHALQRAERDGELWCVPELLRIKGETLLLEKRLVPEAERCFDDALAMANKQGAASLELRTAMSLARLLRNQDRSADAIACLQPIYDRFTEGFETADLKSARVLLAALR